MKKFFCIISIFAILSQVAMADNYRDVNKYDISDEVNYAIFMYDLKNSLAQEFGQDNKIDGEMRTALVLGNLDLIKIKKEMILNIHGEHLAFFGGNIDSEKFKRITKPLIQAVNDYTSTVKNIELTDALIYMYMQTPEFYGKPWVSDYPKHLLHNAESIAVSRFDNKYWFNKIKICYDNNSRKQDMIEVIAECSREYQQIVTEETGRVLRQLEPHRKLYEELH